MRFPHITILIIFSLYSECASATDAQSSLGGQTHEASQQNSADRTPTNADQTDANSEYKLGEMYETGTGVAQDYAKALQFYRKAAEQGNANGQTKLGGAYLLGKGVQKDDAEAVKWFRKAAEQGDAFGETLFGSTFSDGLGGQPKDYAKAVDWWMKAANQGNGPTSKSLA
jgi:TPR repeat protein